VGGVDIDKETLKVRAQIGYLPENCPLYPEMEVTEYLGYVARLHHMKKSELKKNIREVINVCGLKEVVGRPLGELSKGFRQRVGLAAAMVHSPSILILDEPTSGLDPNQIQEIRNLIKEIGKERTVILSTHILQEVEAVCHRAIIINKGKIVGQGSLDELTKLSKGGHRYYASIKAGQNFIKSAAAKLSEIELVDFRSKPEDEWQKTIFTSSNGGVKSEDIFKLVVDNGWSLKELYQETSSMEDVFRTLTQ
jgi:ABC-2 type transport system ATP-binding protein